MARGGRIGTACQVERNATRKSRGNHLPGDNTFVPFDFAVQRQRSGCWGSGQAHFAVSTVGAQAPGEFQFLAGLAGQRQVAERFGRRDSRGADSSCAAAKRSNRRCKATGSALNRAMSRAMPSAVVVARPPPRTGRPRRMTWGGKPGDLGLPPCFFVAGEFGHLRQVIAELWVPGGELRQQFVANAVAREREVAIGRVFAPGLLARVEKGLNLGAGGAEQWPENRAPLRGLQFWINSG